MVKEFSLGLFLFAALLASLACQLFSPQKVQEVVQKTLLTVAQVVTQAAQERRPRWPRPRKRGRGGRTIKRRPAVALPQRLAQLPLHGQGGSERAFPCQSPGRAGGHFGLAEGAGTDFPSGDPVGESASIDGRGLSDRSGALCAFW